MATINVIPIVNVPSANRVNVSTNRERNTHPKFNTNRKRYTKQPLCNNRRKHSNTNSKCNTKM